MQVFQWLKALAAFAVLLIVSSEVCAFDNSLSRAGIKEHQQNESLGYNSLAKELAGQEAEMSITLAGSSLWQGMADAVVSGNRAYCWMAYGLEVVDITNPATPVFYTGIPTRHSTQNLR